MKTLFFFFQITEVVKTIQAKKGDIHVRNFPWAGGGSSGFDSFSPEPFVGLVRNRNGDKTQSDGRGYMHLPGGGISLPLTALMTIVKIV